MENIKDQFKLFLLNVVLPNKKGYSRWINKNNIESRLNDIESIYETEFGVNLFLLDLSDKKSFISVLKDNQNDKTKENYWNYNKDAGNGIPNAIINTHFVSFIKYYDHNIRFSELQEIVDMLHKELGSTFCSDFQRERIKHNGNSRVASNYLIFGGVRDNYWTINLGSEREIQYHIFFDKKQIGYGLAFNAQPTINNTNPVETATPFIKAFFSKETYFKNLLSDYCYVENDEETLKNISAGDFVCFGKSLKLEEVDNKYTIPGLSFIEMVYDMQNKQYDAYKEIWNNKNGLNKKNMTLIKYTELFNHKKQIILQGAPGTGKTYTAKDIAEQLIFNEVSFNKHEQAERLKTSEQFKLVQFHPSYTYDDFVRGIVVEIENNQPKYTTKNKILGEFAEDALTNWRKSKMSPNALSKEEWVEKHLKAFKEDIQDKLEKGEIIKLKEDFKPIITAIEEDSFRCNRYNNLQDSVLLKDKDIIYGYIGLYMKNPTIKIKDNTNLSKSARSGMYYLYQNLINRFNEYLEKEGIYFADSGKNEQQIAENNYVLIIDEINRANLSSVLGELIYALEYRGEKVESMYAIDGDNELILPPNLYIIGTMNTADRSVGQIDYAIRRRFAFIDVLPKSLTGEVDNFDEELFKKVSSFFIANIEEYIANPNVVLKRSEYLSDEFSPEDVWIGHSYFILKDDNREIRLNYEIKPILREYLKDGILKESANGEDTKTAINSL